VFWPKLTLSPSGESFSVLIKTSKLLHPPDNLGLKILMTAYELRRKAEKLWRIIRNCVVYFILAVAFFKHSAYYSEITKAIIDVLFFELFIFMPLFKVSVESNTWVFFWGTLCLKPCQI
jgi:hypothetical protein